MSADNRELREILESNIGEVYKRAHQTLGDGTSAKAVTRRVMALLKRTYQAGLSVTPETVRRLTDDCCREQISYDTKRTAFRDGVIADMPDFDTAIASITGEEMRVKVRSDAEDKVSDAHKAGCREETPQGRAAFARSAVEEEETEEDSPERRTREEISGKEARRGKKARRRPAEDDPDDDYDDYDEDEYEPLFERKERTPVLPVIGVCVLILLLCCAMLCLVVMLMHRGVLPGGSSPFAVGFAEWFNGHIFPLF